MTTTETATPPGIDFDNLTFTFTPTKTMYVANASAGGAWTDGEYVPFGPLPIHPAAGILNYGQGLIEGLRAVRTADGAVVLFRPVENARRINTGCERLCMPAFPEDRFVELVKRLVRENLEYVPPVGKGSLYLRPILFGSSPVLGVRPADDYVFCVFCSPVGPYFKGKISPIHLEVTTDFHRAAPKGTGHVKATCNYASGMLASRRAKAKGFDECIYLDAKTETNFEEVGSANFFAVKDGRVLTPRRGSLLPGITRDAILTLAREQLGVEAVEADLSVEDVFASDEAFCSGTAAVVCPIGSITHGGERKQFADGDTTGPITQRLYDALTAIQGRTAPDPFGWVVPVIG